MLKCIIIEDQPPAQRILQKYIADTNNLSLEHTFSDVITAKVYLSKEAIDLIFLDIHLPKVSGIDFLKSEPNHPQVILTTAFSDYALESYQYHVVDYLLKPFSFERFSQAVSKSMALKRVELQEKDPVEDSYYIKSGYDLIQVKSQNILYIKSDADYTEIVTTNKNYLSTDSLKQWLEKLNDSFCQIHKSYIINTSSVRKVSANKIYLLNDVILPIGRTFKKDFLEKYIK